MSIFLGSLAGVLPCIQGMETDASLDNRILKAARKFREVVDASLHPMKTWMLSELDMVIFGNDWLVAWQALKAGQDDIKDMVESDVAEARLEQLLKAAKRLDAALTTALQILARMDAAAHEKYGSLLFFACRANFETLLDHTGILDFLKFKAAAMQQSLKEIAAEVMHVTSEFGCSNESSWKFTLPDNATLEQVREKALETIDNLDGDKVAGLVKKLTEE